MHRDIKPENILLDKQGRVKIADFGLAKLVSREGGGLALTGAGQVMGTPHYMAPEQVERPQEVDHRADIYSLGVVFYQMLTGELPLGRFAPPSQKVQIDVRLDEVVLRALEKEPERRYQQASEMKTEVEIVSQAAPVSPPQPSTGAPVVSKPDRGSAASSQPAPRLSRTAIVGAVWTPFCIALLAAFFVGVYFLTTAQPSQARHTDQPAVHTGSGPGIATLPLLIILSAPGSTILGLVALRQIRRSAGRLYGLGLALFDALLFPLLALDGLIGGCWYGFLKSVVGEHAEPDTSFVLSAALLTSVVVDFLIVRSAWRAVS